jgi:hypothetical protein
VPRRESIHPERNPRFPVAEQPASSRPRSGGARRAAPVETERRAAAPGFVEEEHCPRVRLPDDENRLPRDAVRGMPLRQQLRSHRRRQFLFVLASSDRELTRSLVHAFCDTTQAWMETSDGTMGRKLTAVAAESPFELLEARAWVYANTDFNPGSPARLAADAIATIGRRHPNLADRVDRWLADLEELAARDAFLYSVNDYAVMLRK